jgi:hypothetical protein
MSKTKGYKESDETRAKKVKGWEKRREREAIEKANGTFYRKTPKLNCRAKTVIIDNTEYPCLSDAARAVNRSPANLRRILLNGSNPDWRYK